MRTYLSLLLGIVLLASSCRKTENVVPSGASADIAATAKQSRPISGNMYYQFASDYDLPCDCGSNFPAGNFYGSGTMTHLGNANSKIKPCVSPIFSGTTQIGNHVAIECATFIAANGDEIWCTTRPYNLMFGATAASGTAIVDFVGGTGRFANATGTVTGLVTVPYGTGTASFTNINGTINY